MEETVLIKERLQAITNKRKVQQDIASKRLEIDREKLKLQHLKKRALRDLWLMSGPSGGDDQKVQNDAQQTKTLQSNIHRMEKEVEALEREELNICRNEEFILTRLRAVERSNEDIIKAANDNFRSEALQVHPGTPDAVKPFTPLNIRKTLTVGHTPRHDHNKPALYAVEINVQKDMRTGESRVLSTCTVSAQELQCRGVKVYDDGRKTVYAVRQGHARSREEDQLSPGEVDDLLKQAGMRKQKHQEQLEAPCLLNQQRNIRSAVCPPSDWPELEYIDSEQDDPAQVYQGLRPDQEYYQDREPRRDLTPTRSPLPVYPGPPASPAPPPRTPSAAPSDEPVTMIFMGYQRAEDDARSFEGSVQAELIIIEDAEEEPAPGRQGDRPRPRRGRDDATAHPSEENSATGSRKTKTGRLKSCCMLM